MLLKDLNIKTLNTGDKSARVVLETLRPEDIVELKELADVMEVEVYFKVVDNQKNKD